MSYTVTCPDPECKTTFQVEQSDFDQMYESSEPILCPTCEEFFNWDYDPDKPEGQEITLTSRVAFAEDDEEEEEEEDDEEDDEYEESESSGPL